MRSEKYAHLAERITRLLIREKELDAFHRTEAEKKNHILQGLIEHKDIHPDYLAENFFPLGNTGKQPVSFNPYLY